MMYTGCLLPNVTFAQEYFGYKLFYFSVIINIISDTVTVTVIYYSAKL